MLPLLAPILAQLVTLNVADRTEARYISGDYSRAEAATRPLVGLSFGWRRGAITLSYMPSFTVTPLERDSRELLIFHGASIGGTYRWRFTTVTVTEYMGYGELKFQNRVLADPGLGLQPAPGATPPLTPAPTPGTPPVPGMTTGGTNPGANNNVAFNNQTAHYLTLTSTLNVAQQLSKSVTLGVDAGYSEGRGVGSSVEAYPTLRGARVGANLSDAYILDRRNTFTSTLTSQYAYATQDTTPAYSSRVVTVLANGVWLHQLDARTATRLGGGVGGNRLAVSDGTTAYTIYPTFIASIAHFDRLDGGLLTVGGGVSAAPFLDTLRATVDPRLSITSNAGWTKRRFSISLGAGAGLSLAGDDAKGAINSIGASLGSSYLLGTAVSLDGGLTGGWQTFEGQTIVPTSWTAYVGVTFGTSTLLNGHR